MSHTLNQTIYQAFGHVIHSELRLPELLPIQEHSAANIDISIQMMDLSVKWAEQQPSSHNFVCSPNWIMFRIPELAIFAVENGTTINVSPEPGADEDKLRLYILGSCMGAILFQRGILPLHGSTIEINGKAYAFVGHSGHGKSTLASAFLQQGYRLITDDVIAVSFNEQGIPLVSPAYPQQKLWQESLDVFGMNPAEYRPLFERENKFAIPVESRFSTETLPLAGVFELVKADCDQPQIYALDKLQRLPILHRHTYRRSFLAGSGLTQWHFDTTVKLSSHIDAYQLLRPLNVPTVHQLMDMVLQAIES